MIKPNTHLRNGKSRTRSEINAPVPAGTPIPLAQPMPAPRIIAPARPAPRLPCSPAMRLEELINEGLDCLGETPPNLPAAAKFLAAAEREAADRELPVKLANRMRFFRDSLDRIRKDLLRGCIDRELKEVRPLLELTPPKVDRAAEELQAAAALLKEAPDPYLQLEMEHLHRKICFLEKKLRRRRTVRVWPFFASFKRPPSDQFQNALGLIAVASLLLVAGLWLSRPASRGIAELNVNVIPSEAELFTNGIPVGGHNYPVRLRGLAGGNISLEARLAGYSILSRSISLPAAGHIGNETIELQPAPGILVVQSEPAAPAVWLREEGRAPVSVRNALQGIEIHSGLPVEVSLALADYAPINRTLPPFKPGERRVLDFGALAIKTSSLRLKVEPDDADFLLAYAGLNPVAKGSTTLLAGLAPKVPFQIIAERKGYLPQTNTFTLKPGEVRKCDFGRLQPLPASLVVLALPHPFEMRVEWAGGSSDFGAGEAAGLPPGKPLVVTISADGCEAWATNLVLEPGEARTLTVGQLPIAQGYLLVSSEPAGGTVSYRVDGGLETVIGVTDTIPSLPLGHHVTITMAKAGYTSITKSCLFQRSGDMIEFGTLKPTLAALTGQLHQAAETGDVPSLEKILTKYSAEFPLLVDQPSPNEGDAPTALLAAVRKGQASAVASLVKCGANVNRANRYRVTPLFEAARKGNAAIVKTLLDAHADVRFRNLSGQTPIFAVVLSSHSVEVAKLLLEFGADPNLRDSSGETPLILAEENHSDQILQALEHPPALRTTLQK